MADDFEGALNDDAGVPPTSSDIDSKVSRETYGDDEAGTRDDTAETTDAEDDAAADGSANRSLNGADEDEVRERGPIPYERFREVNERARALEEQARYLQTQQAAMQQAAAAGYPSVEAYQAATDWARANNYPSVEAYQAFVNEQRQLQSYAEALSQRPDLSHEARQELMAARQQQVAINNQMRSLQQQVQFVQSRNQEQAIAQAHSELGPLDPELENLLRMSPPHIIQQATAALKRQMQQATDNRVAQYAATKRSHSTVAPEGKGGNAPSPTAGSRGAWRKSSFADLIFGVGRTG